MLYQLVRESEQENIPVSSGTHRQMWIALRAIDPDQINHFVAPAPAVMTPVIGGCRETPKGLRSAGLFPGVKKCVRHSQIRTTRQVTRLKLRQYC